MEERLPTATRCYGSTEDAHDFVIFCQSQVKEDKLAKHVKRKRMVYSNVYMKRK